MIWPQYPTVPSLFAAPGRRRRKREMHRQTRCGWGGEVAGGGGAAAAAGSIQRAAAEAKGEKGSERAESLQPHVDVTAKARPDPAALVSPFRCWCFLANDCDRLGGLPMPSSPSYGQLERAQLETATESNTSAGVVFFFLSSSFPRAPFRGYFPCLIPERIQELASLALFSCPNPYSAPWLETNKKTQRNGGLQPTAIL